MKGWVRIVGDWRGDIRSAKGAIRESLTIYSHNRPEFMIAEGALHAMLVWAAAFRFFGALLAIDAGLASYSGSGIEARAGLLKRLLESEAFNFTVCPRHSLRRKPCLAFHAKLLRARSA